jgi:hypothetical protein
LQGFLAGDKDEAMEHFNMAETVFKRCKEKVRSMHSKLLTKSNCLAY